MHLTLWIPALGLPIFGLLANVLLRVSRRLPQSAVPDLILCFALFDALVGMESEHFKKFIQIESVKSSAPHFYGFLSLVVFFTWMLAVIDLESKLFEWQKEHGRFLNFYAMGLLFTSLILATMVIAASVVPFAYKA